MTPETVVPFGIETFEKRSKYRLESFDTLTPGRYQWRVKGLWPSVGVCFLGGPSMAGKSFWALDAIAKVCRGEDVLGRRSKACGVVYIAAEGANGVRTRITGLRSRIGPLGGAFDFIGQAPDLRDTDDIADLKATIAQAKAAQATRGVELGMVVVDTLSAAIPGADENSAKDMSPVLTALQALAAELGVVVLVIAHTGKDETRGLRGWSGLLANADGLIMLDDPKGEATRSGSVVKVKDGKAGDTFGFELEVLEIGTDDDGDPITTCVVTYTDAPDRRSQGRRKSLSPKQTIVLRAIRLCEEAGEVGPVPPGPGVPPGTKGVLRRAAKDRAMMEGYADADAKPDSIRRKLNDHIAELIGLEMVRGQGDYVWTVQR